MIVMRLFIYQSEEHEYFTLIHVSLQEKKLMIAALKTGVKLRIRIDI